MNENAHPPLVIIQTGLPPEPVSNRHGTFSCMIREAAGLRADDVEVVAVHQGAELRPPSSYRAAIITGSPAMVTDLADWSERTAAWIRRAADQGLPILGICYGHQLLAHALGGRVDFHPRGREVGTQTVELLPAASDVPLLAGLPSRFPAHLIHQQSVMELPAGATVLARSEHDAHQIVQYGDRVISSQYHPEFCPRIMGTYLAHFGPRLGEEGFDVQALNARLRPAPEARELLLRFVRQHAALQEAA
ncbi:GMP synthase [Pigmentiphaga sp. NML030171]|uniref:glutamine amidotransferase n=1 Tax=Pigmentiphaga sp. NML030171 TaxID=2008676 RepID=UPI000B414027|nr:glutamine amidotransferase [Pigmentiphaga sp. NML030171]OVZ62310.1 GMP synthase [Pigmentiphaga sp. NML030171]